MPHEQLNASDTIVDTRHAKTLVMGSVPEQTRAAFQRPAGSLEREEVRNQKLGKVISEPIVLEEWLDTATEEGLQAYFAHRIDSLKKIEDIRCRRLNPELQAMIARWHGRPVESVADWRDKRRDYKNGGYVLYPQTAAEDQLAGAVRREDAKQQPTIAYLEKKLTPNTARPLTIPDKQPVRVGKPVVIGVNSPLSKTLEAPVQSYAQTIIGEPHSPLSPKPVRGVAAWFKNLFTR